MKGKIQRLNDKGGFGFIKGEGASVDFFFHSSALRNAKFSELRVGQGVEFEESEGPKGKRAEEVYAE